MGMASGNNPGAGPGSSRHWELLWTQQQMPRAIPGPVVDANSHSGPSHTSWERLLAWNGFQAQLKSGTEASGGVWSYEAWQWGRWDALVALMPPELLR